MPDDEKTLPIESDWIPQEAKDAFHQATEKVNAYFQAEFMGMLLLAVRQ